MSGWNLDLGIVQCWDDDELKYIEKEVSITYDSAEYMKVQIIATNIDITSIQSSLELKVEVLGLEKVEICGIIYLLTPEQFDKLNSVKDYWITEKSDEYIEPVTNEQVDSWEKYLGLVSYYNSDTHNFELADLDITYDSFAENEIEMKIKTFNSDTHIAEQFIKLLSINFTFKFVSYQNDSQLYEICGHHFLLNEHQAQIIDNLEYYRKVEDDE